MYRYSADNAVTYTPEDFVLFRESPFACWMERLTLENPDHGIPPDQGSLPPRDSIEPQDDMADTLGSEGKDVRLIDWDSDEPGRRSATLEAMRNGVDFIVNGQLALGPLSGGANLLLRTSGYSELGNYLYIPCDTQARTGRHSAFRLCFLADLLHSLQGQLPPQMLIIRSGDDLVPLQTEDHIYHYRAVKQRFMAAMREFRKHRMPDPAESIHFGRWSDCAHEVLKQRMLREEPVMEEITDDDYAAPLRQAVGAVAVGGDDDYSPDNIGRRLVGNDGNDNTAAAGVVAQSSVVAPVGLTLAEQARMLKPGTYKPGPGVYRLGPPRAARQGSAKPTEAPAGTAPSSTAPAPPPANPLYNRRASDRALQNLEFIRSGEVELEPVVDFTAGLPPVAAPAAEAATSTAPAPSLRDPRGAVTARGRVATASPAPAPTLGGHASWDLMPSEAEPAAPVETHEQLPPLAPQRRDTDSYSSSVDLDSTHGASPPVGLNTAGSGFADDPAAEDVAHGFGRAAAPAPAARPPGEFSDSLITSDDYDN